VTHYSGKKRRSKNRQYRPPRQAIYVPKIPRVGGSYGRSKNYFRQHDFKYEREPPIKPPRVETSYVREEKTPLVRTAAPQSLRLESQFVPEITSEKLQTNHETSADEARITAEAEPQIAEPGLVTYVTESVFDVTVEAEPSAFSEIPPDIAVGPELYESYELPAKDLELLLAELDADPLQAEVQPEKVEAESPSEA
jgi:hypothetical protein